MTEYKFCIIRGLIKPSEITVPMKKLKHYIKSNKDLPAIGENPKKARGFLMKFISRIRSTNLTGVSSVVMRTIYNPLHKEDRWGFHQVFIKLAKVRNVLMKKPIDFALGKVEKNRLWTAARIHHFPRGAGFMFPHKDTILPKLVKGFGKYYQVLITMSEKGKDYKMILNETSSTEIKKKQFIKYVLAQLLKKISNIETAIFKNYKFYKPKWSFVGGWEVIVKKNA